MMLKGYITGIFREDFHITCQPLRRDSTHRALQGGSFSFFFRLPLPLALLES